MESGFTSPAGGVSVSDPYGIGRDPELGHAAEALEPPVAAWAFALAKHPLEDLSALELDAIRVVRHKPGKRCVIEYDLIDPQAGASRTLIGKIRRKRSGRAAFELARAFAAAGFDARAEDGISVPEAVAYVKKLGLWLQRKVPGFELTALLETPAGPVLGARVAEAAFKIHRACVPTGRIHGIDRELEILLDCLDRVSAAHPDWRFRLERLKLCAEIVAKPLASRPRCGIHRDFYADQVIVDGDRLWLLDFDLYCQGDPALDLGNFIAHVTEQSLRLFGHPAALAPVEQAIERRYVALAGESMRPAIRAYALLTLMRLVYISLLHDTRRHLTETLLSVCEIRAAKMLCGRGDAA